MTKWWWRWIPGNRHAKWKLENKRVEALSSITGDRISVELMAQRPRASNDPLNGDLLADVVKRLAQIEESAKKATSTDELDDLVSDGESQGIAEAYLCPNNEIQDEGNRAIDNLELWGIPKESIERLRERFSARLANPEQTPCEARGTLHSILIEVDEWGNYIDEYEERMGTYTHWMFVASFIFLIAAGASLYFASRLSPLLWLGLVFAGAAGSSASVMAKMPAFDVSLAGELDAYGRRIWSRIAVGAIGSLIGCSLLGWGVLPVSIQNQTFTDALTACTASVSLPGTDIKMLIVVGVAMLLGVSERTLTSFEQRIFGETKSTKG